MTLHLVTAAIVAAALVRIWLTFREPVVPWRTALTAAVVALAVAVVINDVPQLVDGLAGPNSAHLLAHVWLALSAGSVQAYVSLLRHARPSRARLVRQAISTSAVSLALTIAWSRTRLPNHTVDDLTPYSTSDTALVTHQTIFYVWLIYTLVVAGTFCVRFARARSEHDATRLVSLSFIGAGCLLGAALFAIFVCGNISEYLTGSHWAALVFLGRTLIPFALLLLATGLFMLVVMPRVEPSVTAWRRWRALSPLHDYLVTIHPEVRLPREGLDAVLREHRAVIEIQDALTRVNVDTSTAADLDKIAVALRRPTAEGIPASRLLPVAGDHRSEVALLLSLASAFTRTRNRELAPITRQ